MATIVTLKKMSMEKLTARAVALGFKPSDSDTKDQIANFVLAAENAPISETPVVGSTTQKAPKAEHVYNCKDMKMVRGNVRAMVAELNSESGSVRRTLSANNQTLVLNAHWGNGDPTVFTVNGELRSNDQIETYAWLAIRLGFKAAPIEAVEVDDEAGAAYEASINSEYNDEAVSA